MLTTLWRELHRLDEQIEALQPGTDEYEKALRNLRDLTHIENMILERPEFSQWNVSRLDKFLNNAPLIGAVGTGVVAVLTLHHERFEIITSRAFGLIRSKL